MYLLSLIVQRCNCPSVDAIEYINSHANIVIECSFALLKFMQVLMSVVSTVDVNECIFCVNEQQKV